MAETNKQLLPAAVDLPGYDIPEQVAAVPNTVSADNTLVKNTRIDKLLNILLMKPHQGSPDRTLFKQIEGDDLKGFWRLDIQESDWDHLIDRGFTWKQLEAFVDGNGKIWGVIVGPLCLSWNFNLRLGCNDKMRINSICFGRIKNQQDDAEVKNAFDGFVRLLRASKEGDNELKVYSESILIDFLCDHDIQITELIFYCFKHTNTELLDKLFLHLHFGKLGIFRCSFIDGGLALCDYLINRKYPLEKLVLLAADIDASMLALTLRHSSCVKKLHLSDCNYTEVHWSMLIKTISGMKGLEFVKLYIGDHLYPKLTEWLLRLMTNASLRRIRYSMNRATPLDDDMKTANTENILAALEASQHILQLDTGGTSFIDKGIWQSQIIPILICRQIKHTSRILLGMNPDDVACLFGQMLCHSDEKLNVDAVFGILCNTSDTVKTLWDDGHNDRTAMLETAVYDSAA